MQSCKVEVDWRLKILEVLLIRQKNSRISWFLRWTSQWFVWVAVERKLKRRLCLTRGITRSLLHDPPSIVAENSIKHLQKVGTKTHTLIQIRCGSITSPFNFLVAASPRQNRARFVSKKWWHVTWPGNHPMSKQDCYVLRTHVFQVPILLMNHKGYHGACFLLLM